MVTLSEAEKAVLAEFKAIEARAVALVDEIGGSRELSLVKTKVQEARMWLEEHLGGKN